MAPTNFNSSNGRSAASEREGGRQSEREEGKGGEQERESKRASQIGMPTDQ